MSTIEEDKKEYEEMVEDVATFDEVAANYLREAVKLPGFNYSKYVIECFKFDETPQGMYYWFDLEEELIFQYGEKYSY